MLSVHGQRIPLFCDKFFLVCFSHQILNNAFSQLDYMYHYTCNFLTAHSILTVSYIQTRKCCENSGGLVPIYPSLSLLSLYSGYFILQTMSKTCVHLWWSELAVSYEVVSVDETNCTLTEVLLLFLTSCICEYMVSFSSQDALACQLICFSANGQTEISGKGTKINSITLYKTPCREGVIATCEPDCDHKHARNKYKRTVMFLPNPFITTSSRSVLRSVYN